MKKVISFLILCIILVGLIGCSKGNQNEQTKRLLTSDEIIKIVFEQFPKERKEAITFDLKEIKLNKIILEEKMGSITDKHFIGKEVYEIEFTIKDKSVRPTNRFVFATLENYKIIGYGYVD